MHWMYKILLALSICVSLVAAQDPRPARAQINGTTWTCIIICGGAAAYYFIKLGIDNGKADNQGRAVDGLIDKDWNTLPDGKPLQQSNLRYIRGKIIDDVIDSQTSKTKQSQFSKYRSNYESLRTCWNNFVYGGSTTADKSQSGTKKTSANGPAATGTSKQNAVQGAPASAGADGSQAGSAGASTDADTTGTLKQSGTKPTPTPAGDGSCVQDSDKVIAALSMPIDDIDLKQAFSNGASLFQQITNLNMGSYEDDDNLRAAYLYALANDLDKKLTGTAGAAGNIDLTDIATNCVTSLNTLKCLSTLGSAEATAAQDRRKDVACDVAMRAQLPMVTTIYRLRANTITFVQGGPDYVEQVPEGPNHNFGAVPGC